mmetsp:Transcript_14875/g.22370  ORF Transcript_14875/g.22370 Transcript_14875/m.22370 type:complete len:921 (+) Transcript_14875:144-2906(+)|eukprot:CAMPEP_0185032678 /NCGR_PEP_ID=MMETSP1103-20130426/20952_1 /TAXON_ID=36769 /ORGANISM="Paraphysomonas bandaiensis, Strain Caron Lab Isolate" /LENGTH=920 /DNA_ID=CAMNT_0027568659 /DNA_START=91 /DNA_END=2853 /DNA_ORIENTATION=-
MEDFDDVLKVASYDGQTVWLENRVPLYEVGNFLGGGAAGTVYEAEHIKTKEHFALKILNPLGYKMLSPALIRRCTVISKGRPVSEAAERSKEALTTDHVWWLLNGSTKQYLAAYYSERQRALHELSLVQCMNIWGSSPRLSESASTDRVKIATGQIGTPTIPPKYADFVRRRQRIFREINNMRKISPHENVIKLENVLELAQDSKCTIFLVMELANGGELFDRIKIDCGTREKTAKRFFMQLLSGVRHCHDEGVCHRDLKPENLLLQDTSSTADGSTLKIADFGFSARVAMAAQDEDWSESSGSTTGVPSSYLSSPMRILRSVVGSPFYVAPEVLQAQGYDGRKADAWSLGVILYAMLAGNLPFAQELATCKRFKQFGLWAAEQCAKSPRFWIDPDLVCPSWLFSSKFSRLARSLIVAMLLPDPSMRISVQEAQNHQWCKPDPPPVPTPPLPSANKEKLTGDTTGATSGSDMDESTVDCCEIVDIMRISTPPPSTALTPMLSEESAQAIGEDLLVRMSMSEDDEGGEGVDSAAQFEMDDFSESGEDGGVEDSGNASKKSKRSCSHGQHSHPHRSDELEGLVTGSKSLFEESVGSVPDNTFCRSGGDSMDIGFRSICPPGEYRTVLGSASTQSPSVSTAPVSATQRRGFTTPPPIPPHSVPYVVAGTPDLITSRVHAEAELGGIMGIPYTPRDSIESTLTGMQATGSLPHTPPPSHPHANAHPPSFHDAVKRSTRFITSVPADEVLETVEGILEQCRLHKTASPIGLIGRVELHWDSYRLDVWGSSDCHPSSPPLCALHLYQLPSSTPPASPARDLPFDRSPACSYGSRPTEISATPTNHGNGPPLYLVEFVRGQLEIFQFKRFYEWVRKKVSELVKRDYAFNLFDQGGSPIVNSALLSDSPRVPGSRGRQPNPLDLVITS